MSDTPKLYACNVCGTVSVQHRDLGPQNYGERLNSEWPKCIRIARITGGYSGASADGRFCTGTMQPLTGE